MPARNVSLQALPLAFLAGCATVRAAPGPLPTLTVTFAGGEEQTARARRTLEPERSFPFRMELRPLPNEPRATEDDSALQARLADARRAYVEADFDRCATLTTRDEAFYTALRHGARTLVARALLWRAACLRSLSRLEEAREEARLLAVLEMEMPEDAAQLAPEVESAVSEERARAASQVRASLLVRATPARALAVWIDGRDARCLTPCNLSLLPGTHDVVLRGAGFADAAQQTHLEASGGELSLLVRRASAQLAAQQWTNLYASAGARVDEPNAELLAQALSTDRLALLAPVDEGTGLRVDGLLVERGRVRARASRGLQARGPSTEGTELLRELLVRGAVLPPTPPLWTRPEFWVVLAVGVAGVGTAIGTGIAFYGANPPSTHRVVLGP